MRRLVLRALGIGEHGAGKAEAEGEPVLDPGIVESAGGLEGGRGGNGSGRGGGGEGRKRGRSEKRGEKALCFHGDVRGEWVAVARITARRSIDEGSRT